jgi:hypothetical protein
MLHICHAAVHNLRMWTNINYDVNEYGLFGPRARSLFYTLSSLSLRLKLCVIQRDLTLMAC